MLLLWGRKFNKKYRAVMGGFCCKNLNIKEVRTRRKGKGKGNIAQQAKGKKRKPRSLTGYGIYSSKTIQIEPEMEFVSK